MEDENWNLSDYSPVMSHEWSSDKWRKEDFVRLNIAESSSVCLCRSRCVFMFILRAEVRDYVNIHRWLVKLRVLPQRI